MPLVLTKLRVAHWWVFHENRDEVGDLSRPLTNKFSERAGERAQMQAEWASVMLFLAGWEDLTSRGGEGIAVKPLEFIVRGRSGLTQPAIKCRGPEYLRIIYGREYLLPENLERLRSRSVSTKRPWLCASLPLGLKP